MTAAQGQTRNPLDQFGDFAKAWPLHAPVVARTSTATAIEFSVRPQRPEEELTTSLLMER